MPPLLEVETLSIATTKQQLSASTHSVMNGPHLHAGSSRPSSSASEAQLQRRIVTGPARVVSSREDATTAQEAVEASSRPIKSTLNQY